MKLYAELKKLVDIASGQFQTAIVSLPDLDLKLLVESQVLPVIGAHLPLTKKFQITVSGSPHTFTTDIPDWIPVVDPVDITSPSSVFGQLYSSSRLRRKTQGIAKPTFLWEYEKPTLYIEYNGEVIIKGAYKSILVDDGASDYDITNIDESTKPHLINLTTGYVMVALGGDERKVRLTELPIELDGEQMVSDGKELIEKTLEAITKNNKWYLGAS